MHTEQRPMSIFEKAEVLRNLMVFPALTVMVVIRRRIGYRLLHPGALLILGGIVWVIAAATNSRPMAWYALAIPVLGFVEKFARWRDIQRGRSVHSYDSGLSFLEGKNTPRFLCTNRRLNRFFDPLVVFLLGFYLRQGSAPPLGGWLMFTAFALAFYEQACQEKAIERDLDIADGLIVSEGQSESAKHFKKGGSTGHTPSNDTGLSTGVGADIQKRLKARKT